MHRNDGEDDDCDGVVNDGCCIDNELEPNNTEATAINLGPDELLKGCCSTNGTVNPTVNCLDTSNDSATIFMRVQSPGAASCVDYKLTYGNGSNS